MFLIGRWGLHNFDVYTTAASRQEAAEKYLYQIVTVTAPEEIRVINERWGTPEVSLENTVWRQLRQFRLREEEK